METLTREQKRVVQIHNEIDTAQDRLYQQAIAIIAASKVSTELENKATRLQKLGFTNSPEVVIYGKKNRQIVSGKAQADLISHYKQEYPNLKFLTIEEFDRICEKYELIYASAQHYIKAIPNENLIEIENAKPLNGFDRMPSQSLYRLTDMFQVNGLTLKEMKKLQNVGYIIETNDEFLGNTQLIQKYVNKNGSTPWNTLNRVFDRIDQDGLFIAAPKSHFDLAGLEAVGRGMFSLFRIEPKDPIVFRYVNGGIQVLSKWGIEAEDPGLQL